MLTRFLVPILCAAAVTACSKEEQASAPATTSPATTASAPATPVTASANGTNGASVYNKTCFVCHGSGAGGAPMLGAREDWQPRIAQGKDMLYQHAIEGFTGDKGVMPAKGANMALTDDEVKAAVDYMQSQSQ